ncbi:hypothetical protein BDN67DRAFT_971230, partial [Paxillus ammoniavirescens]
MNPVRNLSRGLGEESNSHEQQLWLTPDFCLIVTIQGICRDIGIICQLLCFVFGWSFFA